MEDDFEEANNSELNVGNSGQYSEVFIQINFILSDITKKLKLEAKLATAENRIHELQAMLVEI